MVGSMPNRAPPRKVHGAAGRSFAAGPAPARRPGAAAGRGTV